MRYAPVDWLYSRPHGRLIGRNDMNRLIDEVAPYMDPSQNAALGIALLRYGADEVDRELMGDIYPEEDFDFFRWEVTIADLMTKFSQAGKNVFAFDAAMSQNLSDIALDEVISDDLLLPYKSFYLQFENHMPPLPDGTEIDGVLVSQLPSYEKGKDRFGAPMMDMIETATQRVLARGGTPSMAVLQAEVERVLEESAPARLLNVTFIPKSQEGDWTTRREKGRHYSIDLEPGLPLIETFDRYDADEMGDLDFLQLIPDLRERLKLVFNAILYISRYAAERSPKWHNGPDELVDKANAGKRAAQRELARLGYIQTRLVGYGNIDDFGEPTGEGEGSGRAPHWRRAHWRNQAHGPKHSERKLMLIRESKVGFANADDAEHFARVYKTGRPKAPPANRD